MCKNTVRRAIRSRRRLAAAESSRCRGSTRMGAAGIDMLRKKNNNQDICRLHEFRKASRGRLGENCGRQITTMAVLELKRASQQGLCQELLNQDFQILSKKPRMPTEIKRPKRFEKMARSRKQRVRIV